MKNREVLNKMNMYDLLCRINEYEDGFYFCVIDRIEYKIYPCRRGSRGIKNCKECIADWLNKESTIPIYERSDTE